MPAKVVFVLFCISGSSPKTWFSHTEVKMNLSNVVFPVAHLFFCDPQNKFIGEPPELDTVISQ